MIVALEVGNAWWGDGCLPETVPRLDHLPHSRQRRDGDDVRGRQHEEELEEDDHQRRVAQRHAEPERRG